jgi:hypothetical protein
VPDSTSGLTKTGRPAGAEAREVEAIFADAVIGVAVAGGRGRSSRIVDNDQKRRGASWALGNRAVVVEEQLLSARHVVVEMLAVSSRTPAGLQKERMRQFSSGGVVLEAGEQPDSVGGPRRCTGDPARLAARQGPLTVDRLMPTRSGPCRPWTCSRLSVNFSYCPEHLAAQPNRRIAHSCLSRGQTHVSVE